MRENQNDIKFHRLFLGINFQSKEQDKGEIQNTGRGYTDALNVL